MNIIKPLTGEVTPFTFPRKRHSHRCLNCGGNAVACYKQRCTLPQRVQNCQFCRPSRFHPAPPMLPRV